MIKQLAIRIDDSIIKQLKLIAIENDTTMQDIITELIIKYLDDINKK